jgi:hypothetical protein
MEINCQIYAPGAIPLGGDPSRRPLGIKARLDAVERRNITCSFLESKDFYLRSPFHSMVITSTEVFEIFLP